MQPTTLTAAALAERFGLALRGDGEAVVESVATLAGAGPRQLSFLSNPRYRSQLAGSAAGVVLVREDDAANLDRTLLVARDPYVAFAKIAALFDPVPAAQPGVHPSAVVDDSAEVDPSAEIGPLACVGARSRIGPGAIVGPGCVIGEDCVVGAGSRLVARVTLVRRVRLGDRVLVHPGAVLGADGFGLAMDAGRWIKVPQQGGVRIGDDCEIGANTTIDRGAIEDTVLEEDVRLDNQIQIAHNVRIGAHTAMAGCVAVAGSTTIGRYCLIGGAAGIVGHISICDRVTITAMALVTASIDAPGEYSSGTPLMDNRSWRRSAARFRQLDALARQVQALGKEKT
ncbi:UDP-3-O-(3-hydroxymyristoyl)glucosamine N-acyltransferase [Luteimonas sp. MC1750]|uniref:UDP-3-O-(3-hydroxymyristoyl)glucosamine N-acyltransferase n=1 Tax=Luteimonas sp. MC1750 TaxID=2799326 RepID=UPI0018F0EFAD|nr:UDP-3-O-(3-hydroxymyristoyl)glucosamine N-acyltransferase [Luteimonas sp. MC1750]MBJ6984797.1 UDP-3-O-(3-hydroxymyristoyl)glucosamine N-acyltransferase [Luteimonas sp. MC1750]QQO07105.1 UDP-3-O-(3-hydroxymyristoyl)glucosamine N-acyltransferase [Luteimonas sp. MC1750]